MEQNIFLPYGLQNCIKIYMSLFCFNFGFLYPENNDNDVLMSKYALLIDFMRSRTLFTSNICKTHFLDAILGAIMNI